MKNKNYQKEKAKELHRSNFSELNDMLSELQEKALRYGFHLGFDLIDDTIKIIEN